MNPFSKATSIGFILLATLASSWQPALGAESTRQLQRTFQSPSGRHQKLAYLLNLPDGYGTNDSKKWPLMIFLHGAGERGTNVVKVAVHGPPKLAEQGRSEVDPKCWTTER